MRPSSVRRLCGAMAVGALTLAPLAVSEASASTLETKTASAHQQTCDDYTPRDLALNVTSAAPGQTVQISGLAYPGDTVTIRIAQFGGPPIVLATVVAGINGQFTTPITIPANFPEGTYNITASSPNCPGVSTITLVVRFPGGRCENRVTITAKRGDSVTWDLLGKLDTTKPLTVTLIPVAGGPSVVVFTGPYPASGEIDFVVPNSLSNGRYRIVETGTGLNGKPVSARCGRLRVRGGGSGGGTTTTTTVPGATTTTTTPGGTCDSYKFDPTVKLIDYDGFNPKVEWSPVVPAILPAGTWNITEASSWDSYPSRVGVYQGSEVWEIEFLDAGGNVLARSGPTADLPDYVNPGQWTGPLGIVTLPAGVVGVRAHHLPDLYPDGPDGVANSVFPVGFRICGGSGGGDGGSTTSTSTSTSTTTSSTPGGGGGGSTTTSSTTSTTSASTTSSVPSTTSAPTTTSVQPTTVPVRVEANTVNRIGSSDPSGVASNSASRSPSSSVRGTSALATTGSTVRPLIALATLLIAGGALLALSARRRRH